MAGGSATCRVQAPRSKITSFPGARAIQSDPIHNFGVRLPSRNE